MNLLYRTGLWASLWNILLIQIDVEGLGHCKWCYSWAGGSGLYTKQTE